MKTTNVLISIVFMILLADINVHAKVIEYNFDDGTLQGWSNGEGAGEELVAWDTTTNTNDGRTVARSGNYMLVETDYDSRDATDTLMKILTSPIFSIQANASIEIWTLGGTGSVDMPTWTNYSNLPIVASADFMGAALRRMSDGEYLLFSRRSADGQSNRAVNWLAIGWDAATITTAVAGDRASEKYVVDILDTFSGNWGWICTDDITLTNVTLVDGNIASNPYPAADAVDELRDVSLEWVSADSAVAHNVYFGTDFNDVNDAGIGSDLLVSEGQDANSYDPNRLDFGQTYYWRIDEANGAPDNTIFKGNVWSFEVEPYSIQIPGSEITATASSSSNELSLPENTLNGSGLGENGTHSMKTEEMWFTSMGDATPWIQYEFDDVKKLDTMTVWNSNSSAEGSIGYGVKGVLIEYSVDGKTWNVFEDANEFGRAAGLPTYDQPDEIDFGGLAAKTVRLTIQSNWGGILACYSLSEVQFSMIPAAARTPEPVSGTVDVLPNAVVSWRAGRQAAQSTVYVSTDPNEVADGVVPSVTSNANSLDLTLLDLQLGQTYYWRVDEVNNAEAVSTWAGPVWSFSTVDVFVVDDFESYNNDSPDRPFQAWIDGFGYSADVFFPAGHAGNGTGSGIGHDIWDPSSAHYNGEIMETGITVPQSGQSLPFYYTNTGGISSQIERTFSVSQDWTVNGIKTLAVNVFGAAGNTGQLYLKINNTKIDVTSDVVDIQKSGWQQWAIDLSTVNGNLENVSSLTIGVENTSASGLLYIDDIGLYSNTIEYVTPAEPNAANLLAYYTFDGNANDSSGNGLNGEEIGAPTYADGIDGQAILFNGTEDYVNVVVDIPENGTTVSFWFNTTDPECGLYAVVDGVLGAGGFDRNIYLTNGNVGVRIWDTEVLTTAGLNVADGQWHHVVHTYGDAVGGQKLYIDGLLQASGTKAESNFDWQERIHFGWASDATNSFMNGLIDDARVYNSTLSMAEIAWLYGRTEPMVKPF